MSVVQASRLDTYGSPQQMKREDVHEIEEDCSNPSRETAFATLCTYIIHSLIQNIKCSQDSACAYVCAARGGN